MTDAETIVDDWFGTLDERGRVSEEKAQRWWKKDPEFDAYLRDRYGALVSAALAGELDDWQSGASSSLALVLLLDQFTRNIYRDSPQMYEGDVAAVAISTAMLDEAESGADGARLVALPAIHKNFVFMPLMHSESLADQERCVACFRELVDGSQEMRDMFEGHLQYAVAHRDIVARFGRFPHRNAILGRSSTAEELEFLTQPGSSF